MLKVSKRAHDLILDLYRAARMDAVETPDCSAEFQEEAFNAMPEWIALSDYIADLEAGRQPGLGGGG